ncbi:Longitudinals lacking protein-like protein [Leptotrombidium deliense]|uniref:Longitudinals lacking protein-like protein n=1 Tax=Leptotrombidium deliense TaxID=299467 RepID=A0A443SFN5_9ACAR|nr:Longitudinals lacking protein-like protein [Leptotrombidium deliense]
MNELSFAAKQKLFCNKLQQLLKSKTFNDVTFNCKDGKTRGNRLILSIYSSVLKDVFKDNPLLAEHPKSHPENGIVLLQSSVFDVNNLLNILNSRVPIELNSHSLSGVQDIAKVFDIKLATKNLDVSRIMVKAVVPKSNEVSEKSKKVKRKVAADESTENDSEYASTGEGMDGTFEEGDDNNEGSGENGKDEEEEMHHARVSTKSRLSRTSGITNGSENDKSSTNMFVDDSYYSIQQVKGQKLYKCNLCPKSYENVSRIRNHFQVKHLTLIFRCTKCSQNFDTRYNVVKHVKTVHKIFRGWRHFYTHTIIGSE